MGETAFVAEQDFQALRQNQSNHSFSTAFAYLQDSGLQLQTAYRDPPLHCYIGTQVFVTEAASQNRLLDDKFQKRPKYKQRTFPGKPLSDAETVQATQIAGELEDGPTLRRLLNK